MRTRNRRLIIQSFNHLTIRSMIYLPDHRVFMINLSQICTKFRRNVGAFSSYIRNNFIKLRQDIRMTTIFAPTITFFVGTMIQCRDNV